MDRGDRLGQDPAGYGVECSLRDTSHFRISPTQPLPRSPNADDTSVPLAHESVMIDDYRLINAARGDNRIVQGPRWWIFPNLFLHTLLGESLGTKESFVPVSGIVRVQSETLQRPCLERELNLVARD